MNKQEIFDIIDDDVADMLYYDCKDNEHRYHGDIKFAIQDGEVSIDDIVDHFKTELKEALEM